MIKAVKGTKDIFYPEIVDWHLVEVVVLEFLKAFNYGEIRTPIFEETRLFARSIGEETDIVGKEMYTFTDKGGTSLTLKPEMTASVMRAVLEHSLHKKNMLNKFYYISPMFRQERPQAGRLRQFHQFGAEAIGSHNPALDFEMILIPYIIFLHLGFNDFNIKINSLGSPDDRRKYLLVLRNYLEPHYEDLSEESKKRFKTNILRIFDSKNPNDIEIMKNAPKLLDYISKEDREHFETVLKYLDHSELEYEIDHTLVRGLDYYTHTTFEIVSESLGAQNALCGGGRYNLLSKQLGGPDLPAIGFAAGIERILLAMKNKGLLKSSDKVVDVYIVVADNNFRTEAMNIANLLRLHKIPTEFDYLNRSVKAQMREANKFSALEVIIVDSEITNGYVQVKDMSTGKQEKVFVDLLPERYRNMGLTYTNLDDVEFDDDEFEDDF